MHLLINTGGGDAPGLNAVIRAVTLTAIRRGFRVTGVRRGYSGLLADFPGGLVPLTRDSVRGIAERGGTILGTVNKGSPFEYPVTHANGTTQLEDVSDRLVENFRATGADGLIALGGDGSLRIALRLMQKGIPIIGVPKTIDNDLAATESTFGFDTAMSFACDSVGRLHSTAEAHSRVMVVEVMGRHAGWIALFAGIAGAANVILLPEVDFDIDKVCATIRHRYETERPFAIVVVAEGAKPLGGEQLVTRREIAKEATLGGVGAWVADEIARRTGYETRSLVLGHLQRGGSPTPFDRVLAMRYGAAAVRFAAEGAWGNMVSYAPPHMSRVPIADAVAKTRTVPADHDALATARDLGICLGD
ncbi:MAG: ATP-dependent 6-phosphofructokinase [Polyangiaceae bacterium]